MNKKTFNGRRLLNYLLSGIQLVIILATFLGAGCGTPSDVTLFIAERKRIEKERIAFEAELIARNLPAKTDSEDIWKKFRAVYPYNTQTIALSGAESDGSRTLIVSEPPHRVTSGQILFALQKILLNHSIKTQNIGYDGWVKDVAVGVEGTDSEIASSISNLNILLFGTSYKSYTLPLPAVRPGPSTANLDLKVTANELKTWIMDSGRIFRPVEGGEGELSSADIFKQNFCGVFTSDNTGITGWWIPQGKTVNDCRVQARQFSLDSDLVIGAIAANNGIFIAGRTRVVPLDVLPPLRTETLELLGSVQSGKNGMLKQSYNRNFEYAGRFDGKDWAPIELSPELVDTEYGSLLNITDQILKSWSNNGETSYIRFDYPKPSKMPFSSSLPLLLGNPPELTYNWNTTGAGYTVDAGNYQIMALNRTGSLPVTYLLDESKRNQASPELIEAMEKGYEYFAGCKDSNLVRVVQYASLYQIFSAFNIAKSPEAIPASDIPDNTLKELKSEISTEIQKASDSDLIKISEDILAKFSQYIPPERSNVAYIKSQLEGIKVEGKPADESIKQIIASYFATAKKMPERYASKVLQQGEKQRNWIHTPVVVMSNNVDTRLIGGHNLDARVASFKYSNEVGPGKLGLGPNFEILVNPRDSGKVKNIIRDVSLGFEEVAIEGGGIVTGQKFLEKLAGVESKMSKIGDAAPRNSLQALESSQMTSGAARGNFNYFSNTGGAQGPDLPTGWGRFRTIKEPGKISNSLPARESAVSDIGISIVRSENGPIKIFYKGKLEPLQAFAPEDAVDCVVGLMRRHEGKEPLVIYLEDGFRDEEAVALVRTLEARTFKENLPGEIETVIANKSLTAEVMASLRKPQLDFTKATVSNTVIETTAAGLQQGKIEIQIPHIESRGQGAKTIVPAEFGEKTGRNIITGFFNRVRNRINGMKTELKDRVDAFTINRRIKQEVNKIRRETGLDIRSIQLQFNQGAGDIYIVKQEDADRKRRKKYIKAGYPA